jgi:chromosome segregation ATPase
MAIDTKELDTILCRADEQLATMSGKEQKLTTEIAQSEQLLTAILEAKADLARDLEAKQQELPALEKNHAHAIQYAKLAAGTISEHEAIKNVSRLRKQVEACKREIARLEKESKEQQREQTIREQIATYQRGLDALRTETAQTTGAREQAHEQLGALKFQAEREQIAASEHHIDTLREQLVAALAERDELFAQAIENLSAWPAHEQTLRDLMPVPEDPHYRMINGARMYLSTLAKELTYLQGNPNSKMPGLPDNQEWANKVHRVRQQLPDLQTLLIRSGSGWNSATKTHGFGPSLAAQRCEELTAFLAEYGEYLKRVGIA